MKHYHKNPRQISKKEYAALQDSLKRLGDLSGVVHDLATDEIIGGNQRMDIFDLKTAQIELTERFDQPDEQGTVARGFVIWQGKKYAYRAVMWDDATREEANIRANNSGGTWDFEVLANQWDVPKLIEWGMDNNELKEWKTSVAGLDAMLKSEGEEDDEYSRKIEAPIYTPKGEKPAVKDLFDDTRAKELLAEIEASDLPEDEKEFLRIAARRHTVLNYKRIAEYYAHSDEQVQALMENSALVIIDFNRAIELGYVKLSEEIANQYREDYPDA